MLFAFEQAASKAGVVQQTVKDVVMSLVHDDLVTSDKVGILVPVVVHPPARAAG